MALFTIMTEEAAVADVGIMIIHSAAACVHV